MYDLGPRQPAPVYQVAPPSTRVFSNFILQSITACWTVFKCHKALSYVFSVEYGANLTNQTVQFPGDSEFNTTPGSSQALRKSILEVLAKFRCLEKRFKVLAKAQSLLQVWCIPHDTSVRLMCCRCRSLEKRITDKTRLRLGHRTRISLYVAF